MLDRFIRNFLNGQQIIHKIRHVQTVRLTFLHKCIKNECPAVLSWDTRMASTSSKRPSQSSKLLNDYRNNRIANLQLADLGNDILEFARDPRGSRFIQQKLERANPTETAHLMDALRGHVLTLALHKFGSHVIETTLKSVDKASQMKIINEISAQVLILSLHKCGSWVTRCVLDNCTEHQKRPMLEQLLGNVLSLATDTYGSHVIRHVIEHGLPEDRERIVRSLHENITSMSVHKYGSLVIRCVLDNCTEHQKRPVLEQLLGNVLSLATDQYGCFVIEHVIEHGLPEDRERIVRSLQGNIIMYNGHLNSFCSVIHKCFIFGTMEQRNALIDEFCADNGSGSPPLLEMMKHPFGNKVVQKMMDVADSARRQKILLAIKTAPLKNTAKRSSESLTTVKVQQQRGGTEIG
uniref:PUM-HD domain-containing protein n=1 Tax=Globodera rostochiensis TaxID=31243 RepID=A0A914GZM1_GLORO